MFERNVLRKIYGLERHEEENARQMSQIQNLSSQKSKEYQIKKYREDER